MAQQQGAANVDAARASAILSNPNVISPYGNQFVSWGGNYPMSPATPPASSAPASSAPVSLAFRLPWGDTENIQVSPDDLTGNASSGLRSILLNGGVPVINGAAYQKGDFVNGGQLWLNPATGKSDSLYNLVFGNNATTAPPSPGVTTNIGGTTIQQPTVTQTLNPIAQQTLDQQQLAGLGLARIANQEQGVIGDLLRSPYQINGQVQQTLENAGPIWQQSPSPDLFQQHGGAGAAYATPETNPNLFRFGTASGGIASPNLQNGVNVTGLGPVDYGPRAAPNLETHLNTAGVGNIRYGPGSAPPLATSIDTAGVAGLPIHAGTTGQQAIMSRLEPTLAQQRISKETQLINQGLRPGDEAYDNEMRLFGQQENDLRTQAVLQGLGLDFSANQQGFGQAATQAQFGNQSRLQGFGADIQGMQAQNAAQQQDFLQRVQAGEFGNAAQLASFNAGITGTQTANSAQAQDFLQRVQAGEFGNAAQLASFQAGMQNQQASNQAITQNQQAALNEQQAYNAAIAQGFSHAQAMEAARNASVQQNLTNYMNQQQAQNAAQQQTFGQILQAAQFRNAGQQQANQEILQARDLPINEIAALLSGSQVQNPQFQAYQGQQIAPTPVFQGAQSQANFDQQQYAQQVAQRNALMSGLFQLGAAPFSMFSFGRRGTP